MQVSYRNACRRLHRTVGAYFAIRAWTRGADCVVLDRNVLIKLLSLKRIKTARVEWMEADMRAWFKYLHAIVYADTDSVGAVYLSRVPIDEWMKGTMSDEVRVENMRQGGLNAIVCSDPDAFDSENGLLTELTLLVNGLKSPGVKRVPVIVS